MKKPGNSEKIPLRYFLREGSKGMLPFSAVPHSAFRIFHLFYVIVLALLCGCEYCSTGYWEAKSNSDKLNNLRVGMNKEQVIQTMGEPLKNQVYNKPDIWYYYTQIKWSDTIVSRDECTPLFFKGGILVGWGTQYYKDKVEFREPKEEEEDETKTDSGSSNIIKAFEQQLEGKIDKKLEGKSKDEIMEYIEKSAEKEMDKTKPVPQPEKQKDPAPPVVPSVKTPDKTSVTPPPAAVEKTEEKSAEQITPSPKPSGTETDDENDSRSVKEILEAAEKDSKKDEIPSQKK